MDTSFLTRRSVLQGLLTTAAAHGFQRASALAPAPQPGWVLLGNGGGPGIFRARWDSGNGQLGTPELAVETPNPSYLCLHGNMLYACNELDSPEAAVSAFHCERGTAQLAPMGRQRTGGTTPCYASLDPIGKQLFTANYGGGSLSAFALDAEGKPGNNPKVFDCNGNTVCGTHGPQADRQAGPHLHCAVLSPDGRHLLACDLGDDGILVFPVTPAGLGQPVRIATVPGAGPRHLAFHPRHPWVYCINELACTVVLYRWQPGTATPLVPVPDAVAPVLPESQPHTGNTGAEIRLTSDGRFAYASTRGVNLLTAFRVDADTGHLAPIQQLPCGGKTPRFFALDPTEQWLLCANQDSDTVSVFARDAQSGKLTPHAVFPATNPQCVIWV